MTQYSETTQLNATGRPDIIGLTRWLHGWIQPNGAIHGFANHSVWGGYPALFGDDWCGHSTFASPTMLAWAELCTQFPDSEQIGRLESMVRFQCHSRQADGQFDHVGFQMGELAKVGLIHNVLPAAILCETVRTAGNLLSPETNELVEKTVRSVLAALDEKHGPGYRDNTCANQEYARAWARLAHMQVFEHSDFDERVREDLDALRENLHINGVPDAESAGVLRSAANENFLEPAEYYGLMIKPLELAYRRYSDARDRDTALRLINHVVRSAWRDSAGCLRAHRLWQREDDTWERIREPMLVSGFGLTLEAIRIWATLENDDSFNAFLESLDGTLQAYQTAAGPFLAATGWGREQDIIPATGWQSHDLLYLCRRFPLQENPWSTLGGQTSGMLAILGHDCAWLERGAQWKAQGYQSLSTIAIHGRKDMDRHFHSRSSWSEPNPPSVETRLPEPPQFLRTESALIHCGGSEDLLIFNASGLPYRGPGAVTEPAKTS